MKLKRYNKTSSAMQLNGKPFIYVHHSGVMAISPVAAQQMGLKEGTGIEILHDEENPADWYITISETENAIRLRADKQKGKFNFNSGAIAQAILKNLAKDIPPLPRTANLPISKSFEVDGEILWPIITAGFKRK